jgi:hypothetical protein
MTHTTSQSNRRSDFNNFLLAAVIILFAIGGVYWGGITGEFVVDDKVWAALPKSQGPFGSLTSVFSSWGFSGTSLQVKGPPLYRPLGTLVLMFFHELSGPNPVAFHLFSLVTHYLNCLLLFVLLWMLVPGVPTVYRILTVLAFAIHPALVEAVAWISSIGELQMTTCLLIALYCYLNWRQTGRNGWVAASAFFALAGVLIKEGALAFVILILLFDWFQERKIHWRAISLIGAGTVLYFVWRLLAVGSVAGGKRMNFSAGRLAEFLAAHVRYLFIPGQQPFSIAPVETTVAGTASLALTGLLLLMLVWWGWRQAAPVRAMLCFCGSWIIITLWPAYAIGMIGSGFFAGRHIYLPAVGWTLLLGSVAAVILQKVPYLKYVFVACLVGMAFLSVRAVENWRTDAGVYLRSTQLSPNDRSAWEGLADALFAAGNADRAVEAYGHLLDRVTDANARRSYLYRMAIISSEKLNYGKSDEYLQEILRDKPDYAPAWVGLGNNAWMSGRLNDALAYYQRALKFDPGNSEALRNSAELEKRGATNFAR